MRNARYILVFALDVGLKFAVGVVLASLAWLPFGLFAGYPVRPWLMAGMLLGCVINGFLEGCDVFGLKRLLHPDE